MDFFSGLGKRFSDAAKTVSEKTKTGVESTKLGIELKAKQGEISKLYEKLGAAFYASKGESLEMADIVEQLDALHAEVDALSEQIDKVNNVRRCPGCGQSQPRGARFCAQCGTAMPEDPVEPEPVEVPEEEEATHSMCPDCGAELEADAKFCTVCGKDLTSAGETDEAEEPAEDVDEAQPEEEPVIEIRLPEEPSEEETAED